MSVALNHYQKIAAGQLLASLGDDPRVAAIEIDGIVVPRDPTLVDYYRDRMDVGGASTGLVARAERSVTGIAQRAEALKARIENGDGWVNRTLKSALNWFRDSSFGKKMIEWMTGEMEAVHTTAKATVRLHGGDSFEGTLQVEDLKARIALERISMAVLAPCSIPMLPIVGIAVPVVASALAAAAGLGMWIAGDKPVADALLRMSRKFGLALTANIFPIIGALIPANAVIRDAAEIAQMITPATVADVCQLHKLVEVEDEQKPAA